MPKTWYWSAVVLFALGLMCKPTLVTLPFVLLLLDWWPLHRLRLSPPTGRLRPLVARALIIEKVPFFGLSALSCGVTLWAQEKTMGLPVSLGDRVSNAVVSYCAYLWQMVYPAGLAAFYPHPGGNLPLENVILALLVLMPISVAAFLLRHSRPWVAVGWLWYLGMLVPMIGIVQVGAQARADRYTYLPQIGLYLLLTWTVAELCAGLRYRRLWLGGLSMIAIGTLGWCARLQTSYWHDSLALWTHTLECTRGNFVAENNLGLFFLDNGQTAKAMDHFRRAMESQPRFAESYNNLGLCFLRQGIREQAIMWFTRALQVQPRLVEAQGNLGDALVQGGRLGEAIVQYEKVLEIQPRNPIAHFSLGVALAKQGRLGEAIAHYRAALTIERSAIPPRNNLAWILATSPGASFRNGSQAVALAQEANRIAGGEDPGLLDTLAAAYAEVGRFSEAVETAQQALRLAAKRENKTLANGLRERLALYQSGLPYRSTP